MQTVQANDKIPEIGFQTENNRTQVRFDLSDIMGEFPGGLATLVYQRPGEKNCNVTTATEMDGTTLVWTVEAYALAKRGLLRAQVIYSVSDVVAKQRIYPFMVNESLLNAGEAPTDWEDWVDELVTAAAEVNTAIQDAMNTLDEKVGAATGEALKAEGYAEGTQDGEPVGEQSPYYEHNAAYHQAQAEAAQTAAEAAAIHQPVIGDNGNWWIWDPATGAYVDSGHASMDPNVVGVHFVSGTQTAATNAWTGRLAGVSGLYNGLTIAYYMPQDGNDLNATLKLTLDDGTVTNALPVYSTGNKRATNEFASGSVVVLTYYNNSWRAGDVNTHMGIRALNGGNITSSGDYYLRVSVDGNAIPTGHGYTLLHFPEQLTVTGTSTVARHVLLWGPNGDTARLFIGLVGSFTRNSPMQIPSGMYLAMIDGVNIRIDTEGYIPGLAATRQKDGLMSADDKRRLDDIRNATAQDVGRALSPARVVSGKVDEWKFVDVSGGSGGSGLVFINGNSGQASNNWMGKMPDGMSISEIQNGFSIAFRVAVNGVSTSNYVTLTLYTESVDPDTGITTVDTKEADVSINNNESVARRYPVGTILHMTFYNNKWQIGEYSLPTASSTTKGGVWIEDTPTQNSTKAITSGGVYTALAGKQDSLTIDSEPTEDSTNPVSSGGVYTAVTGLSNEINQLKPTATNADIGKALVLKTIDQSGNPTAFEYGEAGGGTTDYTDLTNKPSINGVTLSGNKTSTDLGLPTSQDVADAVDDWLDENITNPDSPPLDRNLSSSSAAAPADMVGDLKNQVIKDVPSDESIWDYGTINAGAGTYNNSASVMRTNDFIDKSIKEITADTGYKFSIFAWSNGTYQGGWNGTTFVKTSSYSKFEGRVSITSISSYDLRILLMTSDSSTITKAAASKVYFTVSTDKSLKTNNAIADAKATGDKIKTETEKALRNIPHETISKTIATSQKSYWKIENNVASVVTSRYVNDRSGSVEVTPNDDISITFFPNINTTTPIIFANGSYNVISTMEFSASAAANIAHDYRFVAPAGSAYMLINSYGSTNPVTVSIVRYYESGKKSELNEAQVNIETLQTHHKSELITASDNTNLFHYKNWAEGEIDASTGVFTPVATPATYKFIVSDYIPVRPGITYLSGTTHLLGIYYYKDDRVYLSGMTGSFQSYWTRFTVPENAAFVRVYWYLGNGYTDYESIDECIRQNGKLYEYGVSVENIKPTSVKYLHGLYVYDDLFYSNYLKGKTFAILGDSIGTRQGYNDPEIVIEESDVGVELSAYVTYQDVQAGLSINGTTYTDSDIGTEVTFTPAAGDVGKSIGVPLNHGRANDIRWWQMMAARLGMTGWNASWSGATMVSKESRSSTIKNYWASCAWYESTLRRCGKRTPGTMTRIAPDYIFIHRGVNDFSTSHAGESTVLTNGTFAAHNYSIPQDDQLTIDGQTKYGFKEAYAMTIQKLRDKYPSSVIICCTLTPFRRHSETHFPPDNGTYSLPQFNAAIREVAAYFGCPVCNFDHCFGYEQLSVYTGDNTHPNEKGHRAMAGKAIITMINNVRNA